MQDLQIIAVIPLFTVDNLHSSTAVMLLQEIESGEDLFVITIGSEQFQLTKSSAELILRSLKVSYFGLISINQETADACPFLLHCNSQILDQLNRLGFVRQKLCVGIIDLER